MRVAFTIPAEPIAQGRPRFSTHGKFPRAYDPARSKDAKAYLSMFAREAMAEAGFDKPFAGPLCLRARFAFALPKTQHRKRIPVPEQWRTKKPDCDNLIKLLLDAIDQIVFLDDKQISKIVVEKITLEQGMGGYTSVVIEQLGPRNP